MRIVHNAIALLCMLGSLGRAEHNHPSSLLSPGLAKSTEQSCQVYRPLAKGPSFRKYCKGVEKRPTNDEPHIAPWTPDPQPCSTLVVPCSSHFTIPDQHTGQVSLPVFETSSDASDTTTIGSPSQSPTVITSTTSPGSETSIYGQPPPEGSYTYPSHSYYVSGTVTASISPPSWSTEPFTSPIVVSTSPGPITTGVTNETTPNHSSNSEAFSATSVSVVLPSPSSVSSSVSSSVTAASPSNVTSDFESTVATTLSIVVTPSSIVSASESVLSESFPPSNTASVDQSLPITGQATSFPMTSSISTSVSSESTSLQVDNGSYGLTTTIFDHTTTQTVTIASGIEMTVTQISAVTKTESYTSCPPQTKTIDGGELTTTTTISSITTSQVVTKVVPHVNATSTVTVCNGAPPNTLTGAPASVSTSTEDLNDTLPLITATDQSSSTSVEASPQVVQPGQARQRWKRDRLGYFMNDHGETCHVVTMIDPVAARESAIRRDTLSETQCTNGICDTGVYCVDERHKSRAPTEWGWDELTREIPEDQVCIDGVVYERTFVDENCECAGRWAR